MVLFCGTFINFSCQSHINVTRWRFLSLGGAAFNDSQSNRELQHNQYEPAKLVKERTLLLYYDCFMRVCTLPDASSQYVLTVYTNSTYCEARHLRGIYGGRAGTIVIYVMTFSPAFFWIRFGIIAISHIILTPFSL